LTFVHVIFASVLNEKQLFQKESVEALYPEYYLIKINRFNDIARDRLDEWIYFLKNEEINPTTSLYQLTPVFEQFFFDATYTPWNFFPVSN